MTLAGLLGREHPCEEVDVAPGHASWASVLANSSRLCAERTSTRWICGSLSRALAWSAKDVAVGDDESRSDRRPRISDVVPPALVATMHVPSGIASKRTIGEPSTVEGRINASAAAIDG